MSLDALATIRTLHSTRAVEWELVLLDLRVNYTDRVPDIGHIYDDHRAYVALTRARKVLSIINGSEIYIDSAQAAERDVVLLDFTISNTDRVQELDHIYNDHRGCVALTRADRFSGLPVFRR